MSLNPTGLNINLAATQRSSGNNPTLASGIAAGQTFDGRGHDFLPPRRILGNVDSFSSSITPITSNTMTSQLSVGNPFVRNPDSANILLATNGSLNGILNNNFNLSFNGPVLAGPFIQPVPDLGINPDPTKIVVGATAFSQNVGSPGFFTDLRDFNPLIWHNPNPTNVTLGILQAQSEVLNGTGLVAPVPGLGMGGGNTGGFPGLGSFPTQQTVRFPFSPFNTGFLPNWMQPPQVFPLQPTMASNGTVFSGVQFGNGAATPSMMGGQSMVWNNPIQINNVVHNNLWAAPIAQPAQSVMVQPYASQASLMLQMLERLTRTMNQTTQQMFAARSA